jgi:Ca2+-binding RTX toxin-like protein
VWAGTRRPGGGDKNLAGSSGNDAVLGGLGSDSILGGPGNDYVDGNSGSDNVAGEEGTDLVFEGGLHEAYKDNLSGGPGNDWVAPLNDPAYADVLTCGSGFDQVLADSKDVVAADCEKVLIGLASEEEFFAAIPQSFSKELPPNP